MLMGIPWKNGFKRVLSFASDLNRRWWWPSNSSHRKFQRGSLFGWEL